MKEPMQDAPPFEDAAQEREWLSQEHAMKPEGGQGRYGMLMRILRERRPHGLPDDFAARLAARAVASSFFGVETALLVVLFSGLVLTAGFEVLFHGTAWCVWLGTLLWDANAPPVAWLATLAGCLAASWWIEALDLIQRRQRALPDLP
jgi:hypothetical protein